MRYALLLTPALFLAAPAFADEEDLRYRLVVADAEAPQIRVLDLQADANPVIFGLTSAARVYLGPDGRHAWAI